MTHLLCRPAAFCNAAGMLSEQGQYANINLHTGCFVVDANVSEKGRERCCSHLNSYLFPLHLLSLECYCLFPDCRIPKSLVPLSSDLYVCLLY